MSVEAPGSLNLHDLDGLIRDIGDQVIAAWHQNDHRSGAAWRSYCELNFNVARLIRYPTQERVTLVARFARHGMSTRAIAAVLGINDSTVRSDLAKAGVGADRPIIGMNGRVWDPMRAPAGERSQRDAPPQ